MEQKTQNLSKNNTLSSLQCIVFGVIYVPLLYCAVFGLRPIQEATMRLDCLHCFVFMFMYLSSNSAFLLLLCNVILLVVSKPSESHDFYSAYFNESGGRRKQVVVAEALEGKKSGILSECTEICSVENVRKPETGDGDCSGEEKYMWVSGLAVVPYQESAQVDTSSEELNRKCDEFIANFRRQMSLQSRYN